MIFRQPDPCLVCRIPGAAGGARYSPIFGDRMKKQYNVRFEDEEMASIEAAVPGARTGTAVRIAALSYARQAEIRRERPVDGPREADDGR